MTEPVRVLPSVDLGAVFPRPTFAIARIEFVFERQERLLTHVAHIERDDARRAVRFGFKAEKTRRRSDVQHGFALYLDAAEVVVKASAQVPVTVLHTEPRHLHRVIEVAVREIFDVTRRGHLHFINQGRTSPGARPAVFALKLPVIEILSTSNRGQYHPRERME